MALYDYFCSNCDDTWEEFVWSSSDPVFCEKCGKQAKRSFPSVIHAHVFPPEGITLEHLPGGPVNFKGKTEMRAYAKEHDVELGALL